MTFNLSPLLSSIMSTQETSIEIFDSNQHASKRFRQWRLQCPESFVLNIRGHTLMLHVASCGHFAFNEEEQILFAPKRASHNKEELEAWARDQRGLRYTVCRDCKP